MQRQQVYRNLEIERVIQTLQFGAMDARKHTVDALFDSLRKALSMPLKADDQDAELLRLVRFAGAMSVAILETFGCPRRQDVHVGTRFRIMPQLDGLIDGTLIKDLPSVTYALTEDVKPPTITLCGSTKFKEEYAQANFNLTMKGYMVISVGWFSHADGVVYSPTAYEKAKLDLLHLRKIDSSDAIAVINKDGYIGNSTRSEIAYAVKQGKPVLWLEAPKSSQ